MRLIQCVCLIILLNFFLSPPAVSEEKSSFCSIYTHFACFDIKNGDKYTMVKRADFRIHEVHLTSGDYVMIYHGRHPERFDYSNAYLVQKPIDGYLISAEKIGSTEHRIFIENQSDGGHKVDLRIQIKSDDRSSMELFLSTFRACNYASGEIDCFSSELFKDVEL